MKRPWTYFRYHGESQEIAYETYDSYKDLSAIALPEEGRIQVHNRGDLSFHFNKLWGQKQLLYFSGGEKKKSVSLFICKHLLFCLYKPLIREWELSLLGSNENLDKALLCNSGL